jgi:hypothetical protein
MLRRLAALVAVAALAATALAAPREAAKPAPAGQAPDQVKWDLGRLSQEPFRLLKATPDARRGQVRFLMEFTRPPKPSEQYALEKGGGPFVFRFLDADGVVLKTVAPQVEGEIVAQTGARFRVLLTMPDQRTLDATRSIMAE